MDDNTNLGYYYCIDCEDVGRHKEDPNKETCDRCGSHDCICFPNGFTLNLQELWTLGYISKDKKFWQAMIDLKEKDIIEFNAKMAQFNQQKALEESKPHCPKCGSTAISTGARGVNYLWGFIGASKTVNRCSNCGYTWKPKR